MGVPEYNRVIPLVSPRSMSTEDWIFATRIDRTGHNGLDNVEDDCLGWNFNMRASSIPTGRSDPVANWRVTPSRNLQSGHWKSFE